MELREYLAILRKRWIAIALCVVLGLLTAATVSLLLPPQYEASARVYVAAVGGENVGELTQGSSFAERQLASYAEIATAPLVLEPVAERLGTSVAASHINVTTADGTTILEVRATGSDAQASAALANAVADQLVVVVEELSPNPAGQDLVAARVVELAASPRSPVFPNIPLNLAMGFIVGIAVGVAVAVLRTVLDTRVRTERDVAEWSSAPVLGTFRYDDKDPDSPLYMVREPTSERSEAMRRLRTNLQFVDLGETKSIVVTSSVPGEGKSTTSVNLAIALANAGERVILVDCDLRRPDVANYTGLEGWAGLTTALIGKAELDEVIQPWLRGQLDVLTSGQLPPNPSELLGSTAMRKVLEELADSYDVVVIDSPPLLPVADAALLAKFASGALVVVGADRIHKGQLSQTIRNLDTVDARVLGTVLNKASPLKDGTYYSGYTYTYETVGDAQVMEDQGSMAPVRSTVSHSENGALGRGARSAATRDLDSTDSLGAHASSRGFSGGTWPGKRLQESGD